MSPRAVVFDIGGVLVDWQPHRAWLGELGTREAVAAFMERIDFPTRNLRADGGARFADLAEELDDPEDRRRLAAYVDLYPETVRERIEGSWDILDALLARGVAVHAITNWSAETWPRGVQAQPRLAEVFGVTVVSGQEGMIKPDPAIFALLCARAGLAPQDCVFVDDGLHNVEAARGVGMDGIHFTGPGALARDLAERGLI
ncbi:MAG: HAD family phosphatase [Paracoccaceae bacterium]